MDIKPNGGGLINVTEYGNRLPVPSAPSKLSVQKEMQRMKTEIDNLNAADKINPNPVYDKKTKGKKPLKTGSLKDLSKEEIEELIAAFIEGGEDPQTKAIQDLMRPIQQEGTTNNLFDKYAENLVMPEFGTAQTPAYRFPGFFNG